MKQSKKQKPLSSLLRGFFMPLTILLHFYSYLIALIKLKVLPL